MTLAQLQSKFAAAGCTKLYAKPLAENDNSKNQVYFGPDFQALNLFPTERILAEDGGANPIFKAKLNFAWLAEDGGLSPAPGAQFILYPQYPEVRFSGFLRGSQDAPSALMAGRLRGRVLFLGVTAQRRVIAHVVPADSAVAAEFRTAFQAPTLGVFHEIPLPNVLSNGAARAALLAELHRINSLGWIDSKQLGAGGNFAPCNAPQCGGFTLEAELGIPKNSDAEPDFLGWEIKQHAVDSFDKIGAGVITLMTPEPTGGFYRDHGAEEFVRRFGYADKQGRADRLNFGGVHRIGARHELTNLTLRFFGYDAADGRITDATGSIGLVTDGGEVAASWAFSGMLEHWSRKHAKAAYVPSQCRLEPSRQYRYGDKVRLAQRTDSLKLLQALASGSVYYDPGIKVEAASTDRPVTKRRSQFRVRSKDIAALYQTVETVEV